MQIAIPVFFWTHDLVVFVWTWWPLIEQESQMFMMCSTLFELSKNYFGFLSYCIFLFRLFYRSMTKSKKYMFIWLVLFYLQFNSFLSLFLNILKFLIRVKERNRVSVFVKEMNYALNEYLAAKVTWLSRYIDKIILVLPKICPASSDKVFIQIN